MSIEVSTEGLEDKAFTLAAPVVEGLGLELADVEFTTEDSRKILRVTIDKPEGITLDDCAEVSRELSTLFDIDDIVPDHYSLEVSSPGLDRRLRKRKDFLDAVGKKIKLRTKDPILDRRNFVVKLEAVGENSVELRDINDELWTVEFGNIDKARLEVIL
ncbi:Bacterial ribosome SSU maturation protein RimP [hydrothermal vent metagenome]|uniref:Bacterial ribosome SSU maturation protein RimP n=1 Tax=hydrothermal vent metagenome TaxID=652676 RepID=A0A3B0R403_9ZZZZ